MPVNASNEILNWKAPEFNLISTDNINYQFKDLKGPNGTVIAFICNHCPYVIKMINRFVYESLELKKIGITTVAIMSNDVISYPEDSFKEMQLFAKKYNFKFPYLYDDKQSVAKRYKAVCTPDIFGFNRDNLLKYRGRLDSDVFDNNKNIKRELFCAMEMISKINEGPDEQFNSLGCSIKWINNE